ncbi:MAG: MarR family transcriptional regulator [Parvibaculum sp.]|jgi:DNA-binding MarR family transcriptional regulator|uniref:MarR family winged helix-turn-helix transcriptional regulator n=1 Tax=Parvibaculum sp. TaxID=2024848 RepID=UPI00283BC1C8|nr:MarR family transcriptional regulator [Parvibaculum sp.]MDR3499659.1 MarR family transcriptional regulator [Parvibaculum sp.]
MSNSKTAGKPRPPAPAAAAGSTRPDAEERLTEAIELLFFGYRDFISDPDAILSEYEFGRAHHRVVHFVGRNPGITVAELLDILRITKQSLARVLRQLIERGFIEQKTGEKDRRQRCLFLTEAGDELGRRIAAPQRARVKKAFAEAGPAAEGAWRAVLLALVDEDLRPEVERLIFKGAR